MIHRKSLWQASFLILAVVGGALACAPASQEPPGESTVGEAAAARPAPMTVADLGEPVMLSPFGKRFEPAEITEEAATAMEAADQALAADPDNVDLIVEAAATRARLWMYNEAIELYTRGLEIDPSDWRLYRHRGHRFISTRRFDWAIEDLERAVDLDPYGFNSSYHLALAYFLAGDFARAADEWGRCLALAEDEEALALQAAGDTPGDPRTCMEIASDDESRVAATEWAYRALRRAGRHDEASALLGTISEGMAVEENGSYYNDLLFYKGLRTEDEILDPEAAEGNTFATTGFGVANWYLVEGEAEAASELLQRIVDGDPWNAFGYIAAETELLRMEEM